MFLLVMDEHSRFKWVFLFSSKADSSLHLRRLILKLKKQFAKHKVVVFHADGGGEFVSNDFKNFCADAGITIQYTHPDSPYENGIERANGTLVSRVRSMLNATQLPNLLWGEALLHAVDTLNVCSTSALNGKSPREFLYGKKPDLRTLRTWGCLAHAHIQYTSRQRKEKLSTRVRTCILLGYSLEKKGYKLLDVKTGCVLTARDGNIRFHEAFTVARDYIEKLLLNSFFRGDYELCEDVPVVRIRTSLDVLVAKPASPVNPVAIVDTASGTNPPAADKPSLPDAEQPAKRQREPFNLYHVCADEDWLPPKSMPSSAAPPRPLSK
ncbi:polyprotein [Phytophthora megakarya]|uniref:Polyprotein n=1 Tax=Phytophthora megakarya TaxID=4795 RepID=A0A225UIY5_9STRA|nr:polyprotein [Phytophthora megakarya]